MPDDYLHAINTALWRAGEKLTRQQGHIETNADGAMLYAEHHFSAGALQVITSMHRRVSTQRDVVSALCDGCYIEVHEMRGWWQDTLNGQSQLTSVDSAVPRTILFSALKIRRCLKPAGNRLWQHNVWWKNCGVMLTRSNRLSHSLLVICRCGSRLAAGIAGCPR